MSDREDWLALAAVPGLGGQRIRQLLEQGTVAEIRKMPEPHLMAMGLKGPQITQLRRPDRKRLQEALRWCEQDNQQLLVLSDPAYPRLLKEISSPPPVLFIRGQPHWLSEPQLAIVGSRHASLDGREAAREFAAAMVAADYVVTSGLALGVDGHAHDSALKNGGATVAVLGSGLGRIYPAAHRELAGLIAEQGALVSEFWPSEPPRPQHFPRRNRIISGLSVGVLVVEAALKSGSLITARYALEQDRDVFALPGSIYAPGSKGCNALIKSGAKLVESPVDIFEEVGALTHCAKSSQMSVSLPHPENEQLPFNAVLANVGNEATPVDVVAERCDQPVHEVMTQLLELELQGVITSVPGGYIRSRRG
ncbi:DNA-processing protein DprA [Photobacterium halotolerans]|uniref:DNA-protecting protein DprA n=1 Tax=Photobacterium halotolerans TaxID=265726 RepID=A0A7X4WD15_9GAMM|nr:DNA-processing protein DprA [Photobacterium halotolerans]NAW66448.1 DNA-protecting protein DprA [Photobacterium halotolerans]NAW85244.1 DNA-protecting protein DprA [Photobacterium halotolerans]NAX45876.1 DNA-protecting protein DprA [Photobacterium halotolerans]